MHYFRDRDSETSPRRPLTRSPAPTPVPLRARKRSLPRWIRSIIARSANKDGELTIGKGRPIRRDLRARYLDFAKRSSLRDPLMDDPLTPLIPALVLDAWCLILGRRTGRARAQSGCALSLSLSLSLPCARSRALPDDRLALRSERSPLSSRLERAFPVRSNANPTSGVARLEESRVTGGTG